MTLRYRLDYHPLCEAEDAPGNEEQQIWNTEQ